MSERQRPGRRFVAFPRRCVPQAPCLARPNLLCPSAPLRSHRLAPACRKAKSTAHGFEGPNVVLPYEKCSAGHADAAGRRNARRSRALLSSRSLRHGTTASPRRRGLGHSRSYPSWRRHQAAAQRSPASRRKDRQAGVRTLRGSKKRRRYKGSGAGLYKPTNSGAARKESGEQQGAATRGQTSQPRQIETTESQDPSALRSPTPPTASPPPSSPTVPPPPPPPSPATHSSRRHLLLRLHLSAEPRQRLPRRPPRPPSWKSLYLPRLRRPPRPPCRLPGAGPCWAPAGSPAWRIRGTCS